MAHVKVNGIDIAYGLDGEGDQTVVLLNGIADEKESWVFQVPALVAAGYRVLTLDNRGVGQSAQPPGPYTTRRMANDAKGAIDALGVRDVHMLGFSMGGMIAQEYALAHGADLRSLTLVATYSEPGPFCQRLFGVWRELARHSGLRKTIEDVFLWCFTPAFYEDQTALAREFDEGADASAMTVESFLAQLAAIQGHDTTARLGGIATPTLVLAGERDILIPQRQSRRLRDAIPGAEWAECPGGHGALWEFPQAFNRIVLDFIGRHH